jgi:hypothetical protein
MFALVLFALTPCQAHPAPFDPPPDARVLQRLPPPVGGETRDDFVIVKNALGERRWQCLVYYKSAVRVFGVPVTRTTVRELHFGL